MSNTVFPHGLSKDSVKDLLATAAFSPPKRKRTSDVPLGRPYGSKSRTFRHEEIAARVALGEKNVNIARDMGLTQASVSTAKNTPESKEQIANIRATESSLAMEMARTIQEAAPVAFNTMLDVMEDLDSPAPTRAKIAMDLLDRAGFGAPKKVITANVSNKLGASDIEEIKNQARNAGLVHVEIDDITTVSEKQKMEEFEDGYTE